jgi:hypothetical protein
MPTKRTRTPRKKRATTRPATNTDHDRPIPENARRWAENIVRLMWPSLYDKAVRPLPQEPQR